MAYTYDDFVKKATESGLYNSFEADDLTMAQQHPEYGLSMLSLKNDYNGATTEEQRALIDAAVGQLRSSYGNVAQPATTAAATETPVAPTASAPGVYSIDQSSFSYDPTQDDVFSQYRKQYLREGERATANTLGQTSAASAGMPSSYAVNAANQAGDYYATQLTDKIPELEAQAYQRWYTGQQDAQKQMESAYNSIYANLTQFGIMPTDEQLAAAGMSKEEATQIKLAWEASNPDLAWGMGAIDAERYRQITGKWPAGYSTGGGGGGGTNPDYSYDNTKLNAIEKQMLAEVKNVTSKYGAAAGEKRAQQMAKGGNMSPNAYNAAMTIVNNG